AEAGAFRAWARLIESDRSNPSGLAQPQSPPSPPTEMAEMQRYRSLPAFSGDELAQLSAQREQRSGLPYTEAAMQVGRETALAGMPRGLQLDQMATTDLVERRQADNNTHLN